MATYVIGYDIHPTKGETYDELIEAIKAYGTWWHHLDSTWLVVTNDSAKDIADNLYRHMKADDQLIIIKTCGVGAWRGFNESGRNWLMEHV